MPLSLGSIGQWHRARRWRGRPDIGDGRGRLRTEFGSIRPLGIAIPPELGGLGGALVVTVVKVLDYGFAVVEFPGVGDVVEEEEQIVGGGGWVS